MKKTFLITLLITAVLIYYSIGNSIKADYYIFDDYDVLMELTNNYSYISETGQYNYNQKDNSIIVSNTTDITVLTPGLGSGAETWSNGLNNNIFTYRNDSIIETINRYKDSNIILCDAISFKVWDNIENKYIYSYSYKYYNLNNEIDEGLPRYNDGYSYIIDESDEDIYVEISNLDCSKHLLIVYQNLNNFDFNLEEEYKVFLNGLNQIVYRYYSVYTKLPRINLIGHSRGGLVNFKYMLSHPDMVDNIFSLGTPYLGSRIAVFNALFNNNISENELGNPFIFSDEISQWNSNSLLYQNVNLHLLGTVERIEHVIDELINYANTEIGLLKNFIRIKNYLKLAVIKSLSLINPTLIDDVNNFISDILNMFDDIYDVFDEQSVSLLTDGLVEISSQVCRYGIIDLLNNANIYVKSYTFCDKYVYRKARVDMPAIGHNLESQDPELINYILCHIVSFNSDYIFEELGNNNLKIKSFIGDTNLNNNTLVIPSTVVINGITKTITEIDSFAFSKLADYIDLDEIIIPNTVEVIHSYAFSGLKFLQTISTSANSQLRIIGDYAFCDCNSLEEVYFPVNVLEYNLNALIHCPLLTEILIDGLNFTYLNNFSCIMPLNNYSNYLISNADTVFFEVSSNCNSQYCFNLSNINTTITSVSVIDLNFKVIEIEDFTTTSTGYSFDVDLDFGFYYICINFNSSSFSFDLSYQLNNSYNANLMIVGEEKNMMEHYHNNSSYANFELDNSGYYYFDINYYLDEYSIGEDTIVISHSENNTEVIDFSIEEDGTDFTIYLENNIEYTLSVSNIFNVKPYGAEVLYYIGITITEYKDLDNTLLDVDRCYYKSINYGNEEFHSNVVYKFQFNSYAANQFTMRLVSNITQSVEMFFMVYDPLLETYTISEQDFYNNNELFTMNINTDINKIYFIGFKGLTEHTGDYVRLEVMPLEYYLLDVYNDPMDGGMLVGTEVTMHNGSYGGRIITVGYTRILYVKFNGLAMSRLSCYFESSDESILRVSQYGTVTALRADDNEVLTASIRVLLKADHSIVNVIYFNVIPESLTANIYCKYGMDVRNSGTICGTEVTEYGALPIPAVSYPRVSIHIGYTRLLCMGSDAPSQLLQDYIFEVDYVNNSNGYVTISDFGTITGIEVGFIGILCIYKYNPIYRVYVELDVYE